jgi:hypothetical protein
MQDDQEEEEEDDDEGQDDDSIAGTIQYCPSIYGFRFRFSDDSLAGTTSYLHFGSQSIVVPQNLVLR